MTLFHKRFFDRNVLLALGVLPPTLFLLGGHILLGLVFMACVVAGRLSVGPRRSNGADAHRTMALPETHSSLT